MATIQCVDCGNFFPGFHGNVNRCPACWITHQEKMKKHYKKIHIEKHKEHYKEYQKAYNKAYYEKNKERYLADCKEYSARNQRDKIEHIGAKIH